MLPLKTHEPLIAFTADIDWAPDEAIFDLAAIFAEYDVKCTFFCTHQTRTLEELDQQQIELAVHPNYNPLLNGTGEGDHHSVLREIMDIVPGAKGVRSHSMTQSTPLLDAWEKAGLWYDANHFLPYQTDIGPYDLWNGMVRFPYHWEDDIHFMYNRSFDDVGVKLSACKYFIADFHPIHTFLNTPNQAFYEQHKADYHNAEQLKKHRNTTEAGARDALRNMLGQFKKLNLQSRTLAEWTKELKPELT